MRNLAIFIETNPVKFLLAAFIFCWGILYMTNSVATIEKIDGTDYVVAIDGKPVMPRRPNRNDIALRWEYKAAK